MADSEPHPIKVVYVSQGPGPAVWHTIHIADLGTEFDWWCSCQLINGREQSTAEDAQFDAVRVHEQQGEPITGPYPDGGAS